MSERTELPSAEKLRELRESGLVPWSFLSARGLGLAGIGAVFLVSNTAITTLWKNFGAHDLNPSNQFESLSRWVLVLGVAVVIPVLLGGLLQTRFYFSFRNLRFSAPKVSQISGIPGLLLNFLLLLSILGLDWTLFRDTLSIPFSALHAPLELWITVLLRRLGVLALGVGLLLFLLSWLASEIHFRLKNRVSRQEAEGEPG